MLSNTIPADSLSSAQQVSATSSTVEQYPHFADSVTISLLPAPLSPVDEVPSPWASAGAPYYMVHNTGLEFGGTVGTTRGIRISSFIFGAKAPRSLTVSVWLSSGSESQRAAATTNLWLGCSLVLYSTFSNMGHLVGLSSLLPVV